MLGASGAEDRRQRYVQENERNRKMNKKEGDSERKEVKVRRVKEEMRKAEMTEKEVKRGADLPNISSRHKDALGILTWKEFKSKAATVHSTSGRNTEADSDAQLQTQQSQPNIEPPLHNIM